MLSYPSSEGDKDNQNNQNQNGQGNHGEGGNQSHHNKSIACHNKTCEDITLSVPVEVRARADVKDVTLKCGDHHIHHQDEHDEASKTHSFEITKKISAQIPIDFIAEVEIKDERVDFDVYECK